MHTHARPQRTFTTPQISDLLQQGNHAQLFEQGCVKGYFIDTTKNLACGLGYLRALNRIDLNQNRIVGTALSYQWRDGWIARVAPIPVRLTINLDGLKQLWQASRGQQGIHPSLLISEDTWASRADTRGGDKNLDGRGSQLLKIDRVLQYTP